MDVFPGANTSGSCRLAAHLASAVLGAADRLLFALERGQRVDGAFLRTEMEDAFGDGSSAWTWKLAYEACEAATVLFLRKYAHAMRAKAALHASMLATLTPIATLFPTKARRSEQSDALQEFSTPVPLAFAASAAAAITARDLALEPSAGASFLAKARIVVNELTASRADLLAHVLPGPIIGRRVSAASAASALATDASSRSPEAILAALAEGRTIFAEGLQFRRVRVMRAERIELSGLDDTMGDRLNGYGLFHAIISWKLRPVLPTDPGGADVAAKVLDHYPIERVCDREAV